MTLWPWVGHDAVAMADITGHVSWVAWVACMLVEGLSCRCMVIQRPSTGLQPARPRQAAYVPTRPPPGARGGMMSPLPNSALHSI